MRTLLKYAFFVSALSISAVAVAADSLPIVKIIWDTTVPSASPPAPINLGLYISGNQGVCQFPPQTITQQGGYFDADLSKTPGCAGATVMQAMVGFNGGAVACNISGHGINIPLTGKKIEIKVRNFDYLGSVMGPQATANCTLKVK